MMKLLPTSDKITNKTINPDKFFNLKNDKRVLTIEKKVIKIESILKNLVSFKKTIIKKKKITTEAESFKKKEEKLERKKFRSKSKIKNLIPDRPKTGIFGWISNFINNMIMGLIVIKLLEHLPKLLTLLPLINNIMDTAIDWGGKLLDGLATFIDWGYSAYDNTVKVFQKFGGKEAAKVFEDFAGKFQDLIQYSMILGMLCSDVILSKSKSGGSDDIVDFGEDFIEDKLKRRVATQTAGNTARTVGTEVVKTSARLGGMSAGAAASVIAGVGLLVSALGEGSFQVKKFTKKIEEDALKKKKEAEKDPNIITKALKLTFYNNFAIPGMRLTNFLLNGIGITLDIVGAPFRYAVELIRFGLMVINGDNKGIEEQRKNLGKFDARIRDGIREHTSNILGPLLNLLGKKDWAKSLEKEGSWGSLFGDKAVKDMYGFAQGGTTTRGGQYTPTESKRTLEAKKPKRQITTKPGKLNQGKIFGGPDQIQRLFPEPEQKTDASPTIPVAKDQAMNPYGFMTQSYYRLASVPFVGSLLAMPIKVMMGDTIDSAYYTNIGQNFNSLLYKAQNEGALPKSILIENYDLSPVFSKSIQSMTTREMTSIRTNLLKQLLLDKMQPTGQDTTEGDECICPEENGMPSGANIQGGSADFWTLVALVVHEDSDPQGSADVAQSIYNRVASGAYPGKTIRENILAKNQYQPTWDYPRRTGSGNPNPEWYRITDAATAAAASGKHGIETMKSVAATLLDPSRQASARNFIQGRTDFKAQNQGVTGISRNSSSNVFGWHYNYRGTAIAPVPNFGASSSSSSVSSAPIAPSSPAASVSDCTCEDDNIPDVNKLNQEEPVYGDGKDKKMYLHWTAGGYTGNFSSMGYHTVFDGSGQVHRNGTYTQTRNHTEGRNTNAVGLSVAAMGGAQENNFGRFPVKPIQYEKMAEEAANIAKAWNWKPSDINIKNVMTHAEAGSNKDGRNVTDNYGPSAWGGTGERWDLYKLYQNDSPGSGGPKIRDMIKAKMSRFHGGPVDEGLTKVHPGEFIVDKDTNEIVGREFMDIVNETENRTQLVRAKEALVDILKNIVPEYSDRSPDKYIFVNNSSLDDTPSKNIFIDNSKSYSAAPSESYMGRSMEILSVMG